MRKLNIRAAIALAVISAFLAIAPGAMAADPGTVEFTGTPAVYMPTSPTITWGTWGALSSATCQLSKLSAPASTPFATTSCTAAVANAPTVNTASAPTLTSYSWNMAALAPGDGSYRVTYTANFTSYPQVVATRDFVIDSVNPVVTASSPSGVSTDNTPQLGYTVQDMNPDTVICAVDPVIPIVPPTFAGFAPCPASPYSSATLSDGDHSFYVVAQDKTGNYGYALRNFTIDASGPIITITGLSEGEILTTAWPPLSVGATDPGTGVVATTCAYDSTAPTSCADANFLNAPLPDGAHKLTVSSSDVAGNVSVRTINFTIDTSGGLTQGLIAPKSAKFGVKRGKLKGSKYPTTFSVAFSLPAGAPTNACSGSAKINIVVNKKQIGSASPKFKLTSGKCVATGSAKLSKKYKNKKAKIGFAYKSGPIKAFTLYGSGKL